MSEFDPSDIVEGGYMENKGEYWGVKFFNTGA